MTGILKFGSPAFGDRVRPLVALIPRDALAADPERERLAGEIEVLTAELAVRDDAIAGLKEDVERAFEAGEAEGRKSGRLEVEDRQAELAATLQTSADRALAHFSDQLGAMERLALLVAQTCLDRMLLGSDDRSRIVCDLIRGQIEALGEDAAVRIQVSATDFGSAEALAEISAGVGSGACEIVASEALESGDCTIALRLGALEIGLDRQWSCLRAELDAMIEAGGSA